MKKLPAVSGDDLIKVLEKVGYCVARQKGSHVRLKAPNKPPLTIPRHKSIKPGLLLKIIKDAGLSREEFLDLLRNG